MLGLRADADQFLQHTHNRNGHKKSYRFAERLNGRFFVSGISGGFEKYNKLKAGVDLAPPPKKPQYNYQPVLERAQREELRKEAEKLLELEEKLAELQRLKEAKRKRERQRQMKKLQFESVVRIQRFWRKNIRQRRERAANILITFLKAQKARQAFYAATWAASILKKFAVEASRRWKKWKFYQRQVKRIAAKNWYLIEEIACVWTQARRNVTDQFVHHIFQQGMKNAKQELLARQGKRKKKTVAPVVKKDPSSYFAFFLTEGSTAEGSVDEDDNSEYEDALATDNQSPNAFMRRQQSRYLQFIKAQQNQPAPEKKKIYNHDDHRVKKLMKRHQDVLKQIENEEFLRAEKVEKMRKKAQQEAEMKKQKEDNLRKQKEQMKIEYKKKLEEENQERIRNYQKLREKKQKQEERKKKELKQEEEERKIMRAEDPMVLAKRIRDWQLRVQQLRKAKEVKETKRQQLSQQDATQSNKKDDPNQLPLHYNPTPEEIAITEARRKAREAEEAQLKESIRLRIKEKMQFFAQQKKQKELEEMEKKEKLEQFMGSYQEQLQKQKEEFLKKQREKEKQRKMEEKRAKQEQKEKEKAMIEAILREQEENDAAELAQLQAMDDADKRVIASAQDYDDQMPMEDFGFDDFIRKSLTKLYTRPPPQLSPNNTNETHLGMPPKWVPASPEEEKQVQRIRAKVVKTVIKKIPAALRNTPYFKHYFKHTVVNKLMERGIAGAEDEALLHKQTEELLSQLQRKHAVQDDDADTVLVEQTAAHLLPISSIKHDSALGSDSNLKPAGNLPVKIAVPLPGGFAAQEVAPTPSLPASNIAGNGKRFPLVKSQSANQLFPGQNNSNNNNAAIGLRGIKARKLQKEHFPTSLSPMAFTSVDDPNYQDERLEIPKTWHQQQQQQLQQQLKEDTEAEAETFEDPEDNEDLMALIARAKQRLLQQEANQAESLMVKNSQSQPILQVPNNKDTEMDALIPKAAATPIVTTSSTSQLPLPKLPSVQEFLRMQPGPPSLPGAPASLDNIAARYPLSWDMPGVSMPISSSALMDRGFAVNVPVKKAKKKDKSSSTKGISSLENDKDSNEKVEIAGTDANNLAPSTEKKQSSIIPKPKAIIPAKQPSNKFTKKDAEMTEKDILERERQIRARRKGPAIKLKFRSQQSDKGCGDEEDDDNVEDEENINYSREGTMSLEEYAFVKNDQEYREKPGALPSTGYRDSTYRNGRDSEEEDNEEEENNNNDPLPSTGRSSKPSTAGSTGTAGSSRVRHRLQEYEGYEEKLQTDYLALRKQFQEKLKAAARTSSHYHDVHNNDTHTDCYTLDDTAGTSLDKDAEDSVLTRSITDLYVAVGDPVAEYGAVAQENKINLTSSIFSPNPAEAGATSKNLEIVEEELRRQLQVTTKDLLRAWAMEDELERRRRMGENVNNNDDEAEGEEDNTNMGYRDIRLSDLDEEAAAEYLAWLRSQGGYQEEDEGEEEEDDDNNTDFDPIAAHMTQRKKEATSRRQEHKLQKPKLPLPVYNEGIIEDDEDEEGDNEDILYDEEKALVLAERRQRRRQQELAAMKKSEAEKKQFWESLINESK